MTVAHSANGTEYDFRTKYTSTNMVSRALLNGFFSSLRDLTSDLPVRHVLEVGCGEGFSTQKLRHMLPESAELQAVDVEDRLIDEARRRNPTVRIDHGSIYTLPHSNGALDLVLALEVLEHLDEPDKGLRELCRVSGRWILLSVPREPIWRVLNMARGKYLGHLGNTPGHIQHWSTASFRRFVGRFAEIRKVMTPLPWTMVLAEVSQGSQS
jgi:ubiquinone/menaquinone biosynthesis C-methylase UbiE